MKDCSVLPILCLISMLFTACFESKKETLDTSRIRVLNGDMAFSVEELKAEPGKKVSFNLFNGLKKESLRFYLLRNGEDPILVQHIKAQQGVVPSEYFIFESKDIEPNSSLDVSFKAPGEEGVYSFVGVSEFPRETMVGKLIVAKKVVETQKEIN